MSGAMRRNFRDNLMSDVNNNALVAAQLAASIISSGKVRLTDDASINAVIAVDVFQAVLDTMAKMKIAV